MVVVFFVVDTIFNKFTFTNSASIVGIYFIEPPFLFAREEPARD